MNNAPDVTELTGREGGVWRVVTQGSAHILDLDAGTVTRIPGPGRPSSINDTARPLRTLDACRVGDVGRWTMRSYDVLIDFYWHVTSQIRRIERVIETPAKPRHPGERPMTFDAFWRELEGPWKMLSTEEVLHLLDLPVDEPALLHELRTRGQLLAVERGLAFEYPSFQFTETGTVEPVVPDLIEFADEFGWTESELVVWLCSPSGYFGGDCPVGHLHETENLLRNARNVATIEW